jgi:hypothetical protein
LIEINPKDPDNYMNRANVKIMLGDAKGGCADLSTSGKLGKEDAKKYYKIYCQQ